MGTKKGTVIGVAPPVPRGIPVPGREYGRAGITRFPVLLRHSVCDRRGGLYRHAPAVTACLRKRQERVSEEVKEIAWKAQHRLHGRYRKLTARGKNTGKVITAVGRELLGFIWAIGVKVEAEQRKALGQAA